MKKKYIIIATILIASTATLGFFTISNKKANKNIVNSYNDTDSNDIKENDKNLDVKDISILKEGIDIAGLNVKIDSISLGHSNLHFTYTITGLNSFHSTPELICETTEVPDNYDYVKLFSESLDNGNTVKVNSLFKFTRTNKDFRNLKFKLKFSDSTRDIPDVYRVPLDESTKFNKIIDMDSRRFYFDELTETKDYYSLKFYISGYNGDSLETADRFTYRYSIDQQYGDDFRFSGLYDDDLSSSKDFKYEVLPEKCAIDSIGYLTKEEIEMNQDLFGNEDKVYEFTFFLSKVDIKENNYPKPIKLFLRSSNDNLEFIGEIQ